MSATPGTQTSHSHHRHLSPRDPIIQDDPRQTEIYFCDLISFEPMAALSPAAGNFFMQRRRPTTSCKLTLMVPLCGFWLWKWACGTLVRVRVEARSGRCCFWPLKGAKNSSSNSETLAWPAWEMIRLVSDPSMRDKRWNRRVEKVLDFEGEYITIAEPVVATWHLIA